MGNAHRARQNHIILISIVCIIVIGNIIGSQHRISLLFYPFSGQQLHSVNTTVDNIEEPHDHDIVKGSKNTEVNRDVNNVTNEEEKHTRLNVTIFMKFPRRDRLGSNVQRPLFLMAYSHCMGYNFCIGPGRAGISEIFGFPTCPETFVDGYGGRIFETEVNRSGVYDFARDDGAIMRAVSENIECSLSASFRKAWRDMVFSAPQFQDPNGVASQDLFGKNSAVKVAVHIRRGDIPGRRPEFIWDAVYLSIIKDLQEQLTKAGRESEVHIFSEDYGETNWTRYEGLVDKDKMHLAPLVGSGGHSMDMDLNMRDWKHFINADILVAGGTFSRIASYARDEADEATGLPLTMHPCGYGTYKCTNAKEYTWSGAFYKQYLDRKVEYMNLPAVWSMIGNETVLPNTAGTS